MTQPTSPPLGDALIRVRDYLEAREVLAQAPNTTLVDLITAACATEGEPEELRASDVQALLDAIEPPDHAAWRAAAVEHYRAGVLGVAADLRRLADKIERRGDLGRSLRDGLVLADAHGVVHEVMWGLANLGLDRVVRLGLECDLAVRGREI